MEFTGSDRLVISDERVVHLILITATPLPSKLGFGRLKLGMETMYIS